MVISDICTGCGMCEKVCKLKSIEMVADSEGFLIPKVDDKTCISCGLCQKRCPQNQENDKNTVQKAYAVKLKEKEVLLRSSSGGAFAAIAQYVLGNNGVVFGAGYTKDVKVVHVKVDNINDLHKLQGSKYVQSDTADTFCECEKKLKQGRMVLYTGTPCQIAGLKQYLNREYENLIAVDLICHGVPSPKLFKKYITWLSQKYKSPVEEYVFRTKIGGGSHRNWGTGCVHTATAKTRKKSIFLKSNLDPYYNKFLVAGTYRMSCYSCKFASLTRSGDITIGDFWGVEKHLPGFYDANGVSVMLINSQKGMEIFDKVKNVMDYAEVSINDVVDCNRNLIAPTKMPKEREWIYNQIDELSEREYISKYFKIPFKRKIKAFVGKFTPKKIKLLLKN